jgi:hypothetical protein
LVIAKIEAIQSEVDLTLSNGVKIHLGVSNKPGTVFEGATNRLFIGFSGLDVGPDSNIRVSEQAAKQLAILFTQRDE